MGKTYIRNNIVITGNDNRVTASATTATNTNTNSTVEFWMAANTILGAMNTAGDYYAKWQNYKNNKADKKESDRLYQKARKHIERKEYVTACFSYFKAIQLNPHNSLIHNSFAWDLSFLGRDLDKALYHAKCALQIEPDNPTYHDTLAEVYYKLRDNDKAQKSSIEALQLSNNKNANVLFHSYRRLGLIYADNNDHEKAIRNLTCALQFKDSENNPFYMAWALERLSHVYYACKKYHEQINCLVEILKIYPNTTSAHNSLAWTWALYYENKKQESLQHALKAVRLDGNVATYHDTLAEAYFINGEYDLAIKESSTALEMSGNEKLYQFLKIFRMGRIQYAIGNYRNAIFIFNQSLDVGQFDEALDRAFVYCYLAHSYWFLNDRDNAVFYIDNANQLSPRWSEQAKIMRIKNAKNDFW